MSENALLASRIAELERQLSSANSRIAELERDEPNHDDIVAIRKALTNAGIAGPESDEELAWKWLSYVRHLIRSVSAWGFVSAAERGALAAQVEALRNAASHILVQKRPEARRKSFAILAALVKSTPHQCLKEVQAEAAKAAIYALFEAGNCPQSENSAGDGYIECGDALNFADEYAERILKHSEVTPEPSEVDDKPSEVADQYADSIRRGEVV